MSARLENGWICVDYRGPNIAACYIAVGGNKPGAWRPAYLDGPTERRVLKVRPPSGGGQLRVWTKIAGRVEQAGTVRL